MEMQTAQRLLHPKRECGMNGNSSSTNLKSERGFTLIEMIITVAILGLLAMIGSLALNKILKRQRVDVAAQEIRSFLQGAQAQATRSRSTVFVRIELANGELRITADAAGATVLDRYRIPESINFSTVTIGGLEGCTWPVVIGTAIPALGCTPTGITVDPNNPSRQVVAVQTLVLTHTEMVEDALHPKIRYDIVVYPLWKTDATREMY